eukprot:scaffold604_cov384-Prasinococcus_capsulatus_cf.AAC.34
METRTMWTTLLLLAPSRWRRKIADSRAAPVGPECAASPRLPTTRHGGQVRISEWRAAHRRSGIRATNPNGSSKAPNRVADSIPSRAVPVKRAYDIVLGRSGACAPMYV